MSLPGNLPYSFLCTHLTWLPGILCYSGMGTPALALSEPPLHTRPWAFASPRHGAHCVAPSACFGSCPAPSAVSVRRVISLLTPQPGREATTRAVRKRRKSVPWTQRRKSAFILFYCGLSSWLRWPLTLWLKFLSSCCSFSRWILFSGFAQTTC